MACSAGPDITDTGLVLAYDAADGNSLGVGSTFFYENLYTYSEQLDNAAWGISGFGTLATVTANTTIAPDGTTTADTINFAPDATGQSRRLQNISNMNGTYTVSAFVKKGNMPSISLYVTAAQSPYPNINYDFDTDTLGFSATSINPKRTLYPNGWVRISYTATVTTHTGTSGFIGYSTGFTYVWGLQLETGSSLTDYYPTVASNQTRGTVLGNRWTDLIGGINNAVGVGTSVPTYDTSNNGVLVFDGVNDYMDFVAPNLGSIATVEMWAKVSSVTSGGMFMGWGTYDVYNPPTGQLGYNTASADLYGISAATVTSLGLLNNWKHYVFEMRTNVSYTNNKMYINAVPQTLSQQLATETAGNRTFNSGAGRISGWKNPSGTYRIPMTCASFKVYNRALTAEEIQQNFNALRYRFGI